VLLCISDVVETRQTPTGRLRAAAARMEITPKPGDLTIARGWRDRWRVYAGPSKREQLYRVPAVDDPSSSNNWSGRFGIEIEATTKVSVRNIWVKKLSGPGA